MNDKDEPLKTEEFVSQMIELYRELKRKAGTPPAPIEFQWEFAIPLDTWEELQAWHEATKDMNENEYKAYFESVYGIGSWAETEPFNLCDVVGICLCNSEV